MVWIGDLIILSEALLVYRQLLIHKKNKQKKEAMFGGEQKRLFFSAPHQTNDCV